MRLIEDHAKLDAATLPPLEIALAGIDRASVRTLVMLRLRRIDAASAQGIPMHEIMRDDADAIAAYATRLAPEDSRKLYGLLDQETQAALTDIQRYTEGILAHVVANPPDHQSAILWRYRLAIAALAGIVVFIGLCLCLGMAGCLGQ